MHNGDIDRTISRRRLVGAAIVIAAAGSLAACTTAEPKSAAPATGPSAAAVSHFGPDRYGKLTIGMTENAALATGDLQTAPVSTVLGRTVYSFVGGPKPDPKRMAADEKIEKAVEKAQKVGSGASAAEYADATQAYAKSTERMADRLEAYLDAGGAAFVDGKLHSVAAPADAVTETGIKRGSTAAELTAAYGQSLKGSAKTGYELPVSGSPGWTMRFELEKDAVRYMSLGRSS